MAMVDPRNSRSTNTNGSSVEVTSRNDGTSRTQSDGRPRSRTHLGAGPRTLRPLLGLTMIAEPWINSGGLMN
jgi:hypothetical protein